MYIRRRDEKGNLGIFEPSPIERKTLEENNIKKDKLQVLKSKDKDKVTVKDLIERVEIIEDF
jgi:hypothetical protein